MNEDRALFVDSIDAQHVPYSWWDHRDQYDEDTGDEAWEYRETTECYECERTILDGTEHKRGCSHKGEDSRELDAEGPMMNGYWPIPDDLDLDDAARALADLPLCPVRVGDSYGIALTGGGMDLSWDIAAAYIALGYRPPVALTLPDFAGGYAARHAETAAIMRESYEIMARWMESRIASLDAMLERA